MGAAMRIAVAPAVIDPVRITNDASQIEFHAGATRAEAQALVKTARIDAAIVGRQLHHPATPLPRAPDRPLHQAASDPLTAQIAADSDRFHLSSPRTIKSQTRNERQLQRGNHFPAESSDDHFVIGMSRNRVEGFNLRRR